MEPLAELLKFKTDYYNRDFNLIKTSLYFEILFSDTKKEQKSRATIEAIPVVISYPIKEIQSAV